jgi:nucleoside-diphosphate-sugar epimerase
MRIAVTGGAGDIGTRVCDELVRAGHEVLCLDVRPPGLDVPHRVVDLLQLQTACEALAGAEQVVHLAAIPTPFRGDPPDRLIGTNTVLSYNVYEAARLGGVRRVIYGCSDSSTGFGVHHVSLKPEYVPIDEEHPLWPHEAYSLSKHFGERIGALYAKAFGLETISLRYMWVWLERDREAIERVLAAARQGTRLDRLSDKDWFGGHIAVRDVARGVAAAAAYRFGAGTEVPFEAFFLSARDTFHTIPTLDVLASAFPEPPPVRDPGYFESNPNACVFDIRKAKRLLGWEPSLHWRDAERWEL